MNTPNRLFILGLPGAGKGLVAKTLAKKLGWEFIDADLGLEHQVGDHITDILGESGLNHFLKTQARVLNKLKETNNIVVTTDTSVVLSKENRKLLQAEYSVYIKASVKTLMERYEHSPIPLLGATTRKILLDKLHQDRDDLYQQTASQTIDTDIDYFDEHVDRILTEIRQGQ